MVCVPCILLPVLLALYIKFIQPIVFRFLPESWRTTFDALLYPTCPIQIPTASAEDATTVAAGKSVKVDGENVQKELDNYDNCTDSSKKNK
ncbi:conserved hypothetical protein [Brugia malayi]|uniref:UPF0729 protein Bm1_03610 n=3 Tax=Brugia TaxID=6278 RepID=U729_BRUMA|nr:uncharacterized protein BM_BM3430 [Brugia malayi]A8NJ91.1 RecName: Full=UPF0729 protein Bm1_03610 [Brugia malayi]CRZ23023.1 Bm3430 [Brugia malayi]VDO33798.1 unnamed protein product [Brugia timori]VIO95063.1 conserved hypothetical protein [Brugia malayi]